MMTQAPTQLKSADLNPRGIVLLNGSPIPFNKFQVTQSNYTQADTFRIDTVYVPLDTQTNPWLTADLAQPSALLTEDKVHVEIWAGYPSDPENFGTSDLNRIMYGEMNTAEFKGNATEGETLTLVGRNMVGPMIDQQTNYLTYFNKTGSDIASDLADKYNLQKQITKTTTPAGAYFMQESASLTTNISDWDLLVQVAAFDQFIVHVYDNILYYGPSTLITAMIKMPDKPIFTWGYDIEGYDLTRSPSGVTDVTVTVESYNIEYKQRIQGVAKSHAPKIGNTTSGTYDEKIVWPGLTQAQAQAKAEELLHQLSQKQKQGNIKVNGISYLQVFNKIQVFGLGQGLDGDYYVDKIEHTYTIPQNETVPTDGPSSTDGFESMVYISSQLLIDSNTVSNPLGIGQPISGKKLPTQDTYTQASTGNIYPAPGWHGMSQATIANVRQWLTQAINLTGVDIAKWMAGMLWLVEAESSGNPKLKNNTPVHYWGSKDPRVTYAQGLCQMMPPTFQQYHLPNHDTILNPVDNAAAAIRYIEAQYGTVNKIPNVGHDSLYKGY